ncbi:MAG: hypothetical protein FWC64_01460 [Treponema sp.]|nr:hypothetical protein [Treponema sp.]
MVPDDTMHDHAHTLPNAALLPQLSLVPLGDDYSAGAGFDPYGRQEEGLPSALSPVFFLDDEDGDVEDDMDEDESFDDMDEDFEDDFDDDDDDFDDDDYEDEDDDYDYEEDVDYDDFDE